MSSENAPLLKRYAQAAEIMHDFLISKDSLRNLCYAPKIEDKKPTFALVIQTLKYRNVLIYLLSLAQVPGFLYHELIHYDILLKYISEKLVRESSGSHVASATDIPSSTRDDPDTVGYESELYKVKRSRFLWSQKQGSKVAQVVNTNDIQQESSIDPDSLVQLHNTHVEPVSIPISVNDNPMEVPFKLSGGKKKRKLQLAQHASAMSAVTTPVSVKIDPPQPTPSPQDDEQIVRKNPKDDSTGDDENDITGISNTWYSAFITYTHGGTGQPPPPPTTVEVPIKPAALAAKSKKRQLLEDTTGSPIPDDTPVQTVKRRFDYNSTTYRFPMECMLIVAYDLLFGSKQIPKLSTMGQPSLKSTFEKGVVDAIRLFNIPNPLKMYTIQQLQIRADLISNAEKNGITYDFLVKNQDEINSMTKYNDPKKLATLVKKAKNTILTEVRDNNMPITPNTYLSAPPVILPDYITKYPILPGQTYKQRLPVMLNYLYSLIIENKPQLQALPNPHYDVFIPFELRGKYKRTIPRYIRINTNKATPYEVINSIIKDLGYTQLDRVPRAFRFPEPTCLDGSAPTELLTSMDNYDDAEEEDEANEKDSDSILDQFDTKLPAYLDIDHIISLYHTPNLRIKSNVWNALETVLHNRNISTAETDSKTIKKQQAKYDADIATYLTQPFNYRQTSQQGRETNVDKVESKYKSRNFWIDQTLPDLLCFSPNDDFIIHSQLVNNGKLIIQDRSSALPPIIMHPPQGSIVLDACSAPGNKTSYLSSIMNNTGKIFAIELNKTRAELMQRRMELTHCRNVEVVQTSFFDISPTNPKYADIEYILLDPSCSGSGNIHTPQYLDILLSTKTMISPFSHENSAATVKKQILSANVTIHPQFDPVITSTTINTDIYTPPSAEQLSHVKSLSELQLSLLRHAMTFPKLKAIVYSTCSIYTLENEYVVNTILPEMQTHGLDLIPALPLFPGRGINGLIAAGNYDRMNDDVNTTKNTKKAAKSVEKVPVPTLNGDMTKTVRVDHKLYHAGGFFVALFAKEGVYNEKAASAMLEETKGRYPGHFQ